MKVCNKCNITISTNQKYCPLCHQRLDGENDEHIVEVYPEYVSFNRTLLPITRKIIGFLTVMAIIIVVTVNIASWNGALWSLIPVGSIVYFWLLVRYGVFAKQNIAFKLAFLTTVLAFLIILIDQFTYPLNNGWAINYVTPFLLMACNLAISVIIWIKRIDYRDHILYLLTIAIISIVPLILYFVNVIKVAWPALSAFGTAIFILMFIIFFFPKSIGDEIKKRFHA
jgi:hypothetical protein